MTDRPVSIVSGAASGIGRHMAQALHRAGHRLVLVDIDEAGLDRTAALGGFERDSAVWQRRLDVRDAAGWAETAAGTVERFGHVDYLFNIAGYLRPGNVHEMSPELFALHLDVNAKGVMFATRAVTPLMIARGSGHVLNVASIAGLSHVPGLSAYCASKHAVRGFSLAIAHELRPHGVHVTVLCPDAVETPMLALQEAYPEAAMTFGAGRGLTLTEVESAVFRAMRDRPLEVVLEVPGSGRALGAKLSNLFPSLTAKFASRIIQKGKAVQRERRRAH
ncbi:MAG TPA: SDR family oxidoreductase [Polyangiaceae bacterium]|nr:SDR family oxidoreductase [Polyangiaceae bacterium]